MFTHIHAYSYVRTYMHACEEKSEGYFNNAIT